MKNSSQVLISLLIAMAVMCPVKAQTFNQEQQDAVQRIIGSQLPEHMGVGELKVRSLVLENDTVKVDVSENFGDVPFTQAGVEQMRSEIRVALGSDYEDYPIHCCLFHYKLFQLCIKPLCLLHLDKMSAGDRQQAGLRPVFISCLLIFGI